jgi:DNA ligase (NAD+)
MERGPFSVCPNRFGCPAQLKGRIFHFGSRAALDIEGLGEETAALLVESRLVGELADLFELRSEDLVKLPGFAEKSATKLVEAIQSKRRVELHRFLYGLGIPEVGEAVARDLALHFRSVQALRSAGRDEMETVKGIGPKMSELITSFLAEERNSKAIDAVLSKILELTLPESPLSRVLEGKKFVFTGGLETLSRSEAKKLVEQLGARPVSAVSTETDYVIAGSDAGSKLARALKLGLSVLTEEEFLDLIRSAGPQDQDQ